MFFNKWVTKRQKHSITKSLKFLACNHGQSSDSAAMKQAPGLANETNVRTQDVSWRGPRAICSVIAVLDSTFTIRTILNQPPVEHRGKIMRPGRRRFEFV